MMRGLALAYALLFACSGDDAARPDGGGTAECGPAPPTDAAAPCPADCPQGECTGVCRQACGVPCSYCRSGSWLEVTVNCACGGRRDAGGE